MTGAARLEGIVQVTIMLIVGVTAGAASFTHIHDLTVANGQPDWIGWANAVVVELMSITAGLELRRRKRTGQPTGFVYSVLFTAVVVSLAAQVARAKPSVWGWIVAALPALAFLAIVKIVLTRTPPRAGPVQTDVQAAGPVETVGRPLDLDSGPMPPAGRSTGQETHTREAAHAGSPPAEQAEPVTTDGPDEAERWNANRTEELQIVPARRIKGDHVGSSQLGRTGDESPSSRSGLPETQSGPDYAQNSELSGLDLTGLDDELLQLGLTIAAKVKIRKVNLTREVLIDEIRRAGRTIGTDRASKLLAWIKEEAKKSSVGAG